MTGEDYEQDIRPLVKSFFPEEELYIADGEGAEVKAEYILSLELFPEKFSLSFSFGGKTLEREEDFSELLPGAYKNEGIPDRRMYRNYLHRSLYRMLSEATGRELPWGTLTGIRPTKQALERLFEGESKESIANYFKTEYLCSGEKTDLFISSTQKAHFLLFLTTAFCFFRSPQETS